MNHVTKFVVMCFLFFSQIVFAAPISGTFMVVKGKVSIEGGSGAVDAKVGSKVKQGETIITGDDSRAKIVMDDRNIINVSPNTTLKIEKYTNSENDKNVQLNLIEGKVRNNVEQKYDNKNSKFQIRTATAVAGVRGTQFVVIYNRATKTTQVITLKGSVMFQSNLGGGDKNSSDASVEVKKNEKSEAKENQPPDKPIQMQDAEAKRVDNETNVKKEPNKSGNNESGSGGANGTNNGNRNDGKGKNDDKETDDRNGPNGQQGPEIKCPPNCPPPRPPPPLPNRFEKSKVKIITQPSN